MKYAREREEMRIEEPCILSKETYILLKEPYIFLKEPYIH